MMVKSALLVAYSARYREESRGSHYRKDFPLQNDKEWLKNIVIGKDIDGNVAIDYKKTDEAITMNW